MPKFMRYGPHSQKTQKGKREQTRPFKDTTVKRTLTIRKRATAKKSYTPVLDAEFSVLPLVSIDPLSLNAEGLIFFFVDRATFPHPTRPVLFTNLYNRCHKDSQLDYRRNKETGDTLMQTYIPLKPAHHPWKERLHKASSARPCLGSNTILFHFILPRSLPLRLKKTPFRCHHFPK